MARSEANRELPTASTENLTPHQMIAMLLDGALSRIDDAVSRVNEQDMDAAANSVIKTIRIIGGLRDSLDFQAGGELAQQLDDLYLYISERLQRITTEEPMQTLDEMKDLLVSIQEGWMGIQEQVGSGSAQLKDEASLAH